MRLRKIKKKITALTLALGTSAIICGAGAFAAVTRVPYNFSISVGKNDTSDEVQKTTPSTVDYAYVSVNKYGNTTNADFLRLKVLRSSTVVSGYAKVSDTGSKKIPYTQTVSSGQIMKLRGYVAASATYGYGVMSGTFEP